MYSYTLDGKKIGVLTTKEVQRADGLAMDTAGNLLVTDYNTNVVVYSPCGEVVKTIQVAGSRHTTECRDWHRWNSNGSSICFFQSLFVLTPATNRDHEPSHSIEIE